MALSHVSESLRKIADRNPALRGLTLVVKPLPGGDYAVPGRRQLEYLVKVNGDEILCECSGYEPRFCAHIVAVRNHLQRQDMNVGTQFAEKCNICRQMIPAGEARIQDPRPGKGTWTKSNGKVAPNVVHPNCANGGNGHAPQSNGVTQVHQHAAPADGDTFAKLRHIRTTLSALIAEVDAIGTALKTQQADPYKHLESEIPF